MNLKLQTWVNHDLILRGAVALLGLALIGGSYALLGVANLILLTVAVAYLVWRAPAIRQKMSVLPKGQIILGFIAFGLALGFLAFASPAPFFGGLSLNRGLFFLLAGVQSIAKPSPQLVKAEAEWAKAKKTHKPKPTTPKDPKPMTNTYRRLLARQARGKKKR